MGNGEIQPEKTNQNSPRKSRIHKGIQRTLNTAKFESIVIQDFIEEDIEWSSLEERDRKVQNWETLLVNRFKQFHDQVMRELGLEHKVAYFKDNETDYRPEPGAYAELDSLDTLS